MGRGFTFSIGVHALIFLLVLFGLPFFHPRPHDLPPMITVDVVDVAKDATTNRISPENKVEKQIQEPTPPPPKPQPQPTPRQQIDTTMPKVAQVDSATPDLAPPEVDLRRPLDAAIPKLADVATATSDVAPPATTELKRPPPKPNFDSVLKNLAKLKPQDTQPDAPPQPTPKTETKAATGALAQLSDKLTQSDAAALNDQLSHCWSVPAGIKDAENIVVPLNVDVNPDRTVASVEVADQARLASDPVFRAAAMAAVRAVRNPDCSPLALPPDKYETWKSMLLNFDPKQMLG